MAANPFDQFDQPAQAEASGNPFDQFDAPAAAPTAPAVQDEPPDTRRVGDLGSAIMEPLGAIGSSMLAAPVAGLAGIGAAGTRAMGLTQADPADVIRRMQEAMTYQPRTQAGDVATRTLSYPFEKWAQGADFLGQKASDASGSPAVGAGVNAAVQFLPAMLIPALKGRAKPAEVAPNVPRTAPADAAPAPSPAQPASPNAAASKRPAGPPGVSKDAPSIEQLKTDAKAAYKRAEDAGIQVSEFSFKKLKGRILNELGERVDPTLHPDTTAALKRIVDTKGAVSLEKLDSLRQIASDAKGSVKPADQRLAARVVDSIDDYVDGLSAKDVTRGDAKGAAALKEARDLYTRQKKGEQIQRLFERAEIKAGANYTQSGLENALRGEFKALALDQKKMKRFTPEERAAIIKVAKGGKMENVMRFLGKFAPTGVVSATLSGGLGAMLAGPAGAAVPLAGLGGRAMATRMTMRNANAASEVVRRGPRNTLAAEAPKQPARNALLEY